MLYRPPEQQLFRLLAITLSFALLATAGAAAASLPAPETYRIRIENTTLGRVEVSLDGGGHYILLGRVVRPATQSASDNTAVTGGVVLRAGGDGLAFSVAPGRILKLRPHLPALPHPGGHRGLLSAATGTNPATIYTSLSAHANLFDDLTPPAQSAVSLQAGRRDLTPFGEGYSPGEEDVLVIRVFLPMPAPQKGDPVWTAETWNAHVHAKLEAIGQAYAASAIARAQLEHYRIVSGMVTLNAKLPTNEPDPIAAVMYAIDGDIVSAQNVAPFNYSWDTKQVGDGEHVVEISALNGNGRRITYIRTLVVVHNTPAMGNG